MRDFVVQCFTVIKTIKKIGNSKGIILDAALLELAHLKEGDELSVTVHDGGALSFTPPPTAPIFGPPIFELFDLPLISDADDAAPRFAAFAEPVTTRRFSKG